jgi:hypothetical protein
MRTGFLLVVFVLNAVAIVSILGAPTTAGRKLAWSAAVLLLPLLGALGWFAARRTAPRHAEAMKS